MWVLKKVNGTKVSLKKDAQVPTALAPDRTGATVAISLWAPRTVALRLLARGQLIGLG